MKNYKDEKQLFTGIRRGDEKAFKRLFDLYYQRLFLYALSYIEDNAASEDIVQEVFFNLWEKRNELLITVSLSSYLFRSVHNRSIQYLRHKKVSENYQLNYQLKLKEADLLYHTSGDYTFSEIQFKEIEDIIKATFESLPEKTKEIFSLSRNHINTNKEIADKLNIDIKTVEYHISKALGTLRQALKEYF
jgi:RNA polymerase sigma-70 factor (ECF subfamily)